MSADLLAAFGLNEANQQPEKTIPKSSNAVSLSLTKITTPPEDTQWILQSKPLPTLSRNQPSKSLWKQDAKGTDVLFDASDHEDDDEFGDFEEAHIDARSNPAAQLHQQYATTDLLGLDDFAGMQVSSPRNEAHRSDKGDSSSFDLLGNRFLTESHPEQTMSFNVSAENVWQDEPDMNHTNHQHYEHGEQSVPHNDVSLDEDWGNFEAVEAEEETQPLPSATSHLPNPDRGEGVYEAPEDGDWDAFEDNPPIASHAQPAAANYKVLPATTTSTPPPPSISVPKSLSPSPTTSLPRPTNIPPPSTLLQLLPKLHQHLSQQSRQSTPPPTLGRLILQLYITASRIISGRTHRWKRDTLLSQSTRISQAGLKNTGMKLTALDKSESVKEDQEAQEAVASWQRHAAVLNAVMLRAKVQRPPMSLSANMAVRAGSGTGVLTAKECCAVCGLKRNERVTGIDVKVEDSFGEFWVEHWGHKDCYEFWYRYEGMLDKR